jgi:hypothetical protein
MLWVLAALATGMGIPVLAFGFRGGECIDYVPPGVGTCSSGPVVGIYGAWVLTAIAGLLAMYFVRKAIADWRRDQDQHVS